MTYDPNTYSVILNALSAAGGNLWSNNPTSIHYFKNAMKAAGLSSQWQLVATATGQFNPATVSDANIIWRWLNILNLNILPEPLIVNGVSSYTSAQITMAQQAITSKLVLGQIPTEQIINDVINANIYSQQIYVRLLNGTTAFLPQNVLINVFSGTIEINPTSYTAGAGTSIPGFAGGVIPDLTNNFTGPLFSSSLALLILVAQPPAMSTATFFNIINQFPIILQDIIPTYMTYAIGTYNSLGQLGFKLDEPNLDRELLS
jgi:hypothetical protein